MPASPRSPHPDNYPRAALVTGAANRIGKAMALDLAKAGWSVAIHCNESQGAAEETAEAVEAAGARAVVLRADLSNEPDVTGLVPRAVEALGPLGCLINNASVFELDTAASASPESWQRHMEANLHAPLILSQAFAKALPEDRGGVIANMLDQRVWNLTPYFLSYTLTKSGLWTLTRTLAMALAPRIRVNGIGPGPALPSPRQSAEQFARQCALMPLGRGTSTEEICDALRFILAARSMTGQMIALDGGQHLGWAQPGQGDPGYE